MITIYYCPKWKTLIHKAARLATKIRERSDVTVELIEGTERELTVQVDGNVIANQEDKFMPQKQILEIVLEQAKQ